MHELVEPLILPKGSATPRAAAPFLRWAGGKRWLVPQLVRLLADRQVNNYYEPFLGGGSVFFALQIAGDAHLSDLNIELIEVYEQVRDNPTGVANCLRTHENTAAAYYAARESKLSDPTARAARFIFLNHTSYNGIFRVNLKGEYNVPFGYRTSPNIPDLPKLLQAAGSLSRASLSSVDFAAALDSVQAGDLVFLDPPYTVAHNNNGFVKYNQHLFSFEDQQRLATAIESIVEKGADFILTNAAHSSIEKLFTPLGHRLTVSRRNSIGGNKAERGRAEEYLFTSIGAK